MSLLTVRGWSPPGLRGYLNSHLEELFQDPFQENSTPNRQHAEGRATSETRGFPKGGENEARGLFLLSQRQHPGPRRQRNQPARTCALPCRQPLWDRGLDHGPCGAGSMTNQQHGNGGEPGDEGVELHRPHGHCCHSVQMSTAIRRIGRALQLRPSERLSHDVPQSELMDVSKCRHPVNKALTCRWCLTLGSRRQTGMLEFYPLSHFSL